MPPRSSEPEWAESAERLFPATALALRQIRQFVTRLARAVGVVDDDLDRILLVVNEAATNAVEHSGGGAVRVRWTEYERGVQVTVADDGVFNMAKHSIDGRGYGLKIAVGVADEVQVRAGRVDAPGTVVRLRVRTASRAPSPGAERAGAERAGAERAGAERAPSPSVERAPTRLLIVDGDRFSGRSLASFLESEGYQVTLTGSVEEGRTVMSGRPDLVIVDLMTSNGLGSAFCEDLARSATASVLAMSVLRPPRPLPHGTVRFLRKPVHPLEVLTVIQRLVARPTPELAAEGLHG